jgi:N-acyl-D-aspartate/D-glutamate deacylase
MASYDLVIRNGTVVDGSGLDAYRADVGIVGDRIASIGRIHERGTREIDAEGLVVTPGFIDGHTHMDAQIFWDRQGSFSCYHGVTSVVMGNCGFTLAPASKQQAALVVRNLERAEDISPEAMAAGIEWGWTTFAEFLNVLDALPKGINYAANIGHSALRTYVMGERAFEQPASGDDLAAMSAELRAALRAGAYGFTTSRTRQHMTSDDRPVASRIASLDELQHLVEVVGEERAGMFQMVQDPPAPEERQERERWMRDLAVASGVPFVLSASGTNGVNALRQIDDIAASGGRAVGVTHPRGIGTLLSFRTQLPFDPLPEWRALRALPEAEQKRALRDPDTRRSLVHAAHHGSYKERLGGEPRKANFDLMRLVDKPLPPYSTVNGLAAARGIDPVEVMIDVSLEHDFDVFFWQPVMEFDDETTEQLLRHPRTVMGFSDAGAHVSQMADYSIQTHLLAYFVRERQAFTLEEAVRMMTFKPARAWGFHDRGLVREGLAADLNVFDPATITPLMPTLVHDLPAGAPRVKQLSTGIHATVVGGQVVVCDGAHTGATPGRLIRGAARG